MARVIVAAIIVRDGKLLLWRDLRRIDECLKWVLPGGKKHGAHETDASSLKRELLTRCGIQIDPEGVKFERMIVGLGLPGCPESAFHYCLVGRYLGTPTPHDGCELVWVSRADLCTGNYPLTEVDTQCVHYLLLNEALAA